MVVLSSLFQQNEAKMKKDDATAHFEQSRVHLNANSLALRDGKEALNYAYASPPMPQFVIMCSALCIAEEVVIEVWGLARASRFSVC